MTRIRCNEPLRKRCTTAHLVTRATDDGWEYGSGRVISRKAGFYQARAVVAHQSCSLLVVTHDA